MLERLRQESRYVGHRYGRSSAVPLGDIEKNKQEEIEEAQEGTETSPEGEKELRRTKPVATCPVSLARWKQDSTHRWVNCALHKSFGALRHPTIGTD